MKILLDTNVLISAFITHGGHSQEILMHAVHAHTLYTTDFILNEFQGKLKKKFRFSPEPVRRFVEFLDHFFQHGKTASLIPAVCRDPEDDQILADAVLNDVDLILTGDQDLLVLKNHRGIRILHPRDYWFL